MKRGLSALLAALLCLSLLMPLQAGAAELVKADMEVVFQQSEARKILPMINELRTGSDAWYWNESNTQKVNVSGLKALTYDYYLEQIAMLRAAEIALRFAHMRPNGQMCYSAYPEEYLYYGVGENIAFGQRSAESANNDWREDNEDYSGQGHRRNMLEQDFAAVGIGCVYANGTYYWTEEFAGGVSDAPKTDALDGTADVELEIDAGALTVTNCKADPAAIKLNVGESAALPQAVLTAYTSETLAMRDACTLKMSAAWVSDNASVAAVDGDRLTGKTAGSTKLRAKVLGKTVETSVTVKGASEPVTQPPTQPAQPTTSHTHTFETSLTPAQIRKDGVRISTCTVCGEKGTQTIPGVEKITLSKTSYTCNGKIHTPAVTVTDRKGKVLREGADYRLTYSKGRKNIGIYRVKVIFLGDYTGSKKLSYKIIPGKVTGLNAKAEKERVVLSWKPVAGAKSYAIYYTTDKNQPYIKIGSTTKPSAPIRNLQAGRTYYFRVRACAKVGGKAYKGALSEVKEFKCK